MDLAWISVGALAVTILVSCTTRMNPGVLALALAWIIAVFIAPALGHSLAIKSLLGGFPSELFLTLAGVTLLFAQAQVNGTLDKAANVAVGCCRGQAGLIPFVFFGLAALMSAVGAGSVATAALLAPVAMASAARARIPPFLMVIMIGHGAVAGGMSPFAMTGIIANGLMQRMELGGYEAQTFLHNFAANALVAAVGYLLFGGAALIWKTRAGVVAASGAAAQQKDAGDRVEAKHWVTVSVIALWILGVLIWKFHVGLAAFAAATTLVLAGAADETDSFRAMPWPVMLMVCGVTVLTSLIETTGGIDRVTGLIAAISNERSLPGILAFATGLISVYSSTSGVVLPALLPSVPALVEKVGGDALALASSINIGGNLVDVSPLSTIGALCIACAAASENRRVLFNQVLAWGLSMAVVAAIFCMLSFV